MLTEQIASSQSDLQGRSSELANCHSLLEGIGPVLERWLYAAGICTYEALAAATEQLLERICQPPAFQSPDYER